MRLGFALIVLATAVPAWAAEPSLPQFRPSIRLSELRELPEEQLVRRVFGPLDSFPHVSHRQSLDRSAPHGRATLWFWSRPRAGGHAGVCRTDRLIVLFETGPFYVGDRKDPAMGPTRFDMQSYFIVENRKEAFGPYDPKERKSFELDDACSRLDPRRDSVAADHASQLVRALKLVEALGDAARAGRKLAPLDCTRLNWNGEPPADDAACLNALKGLRQHSVGWVQDCRPRRAAPGGCTQVLADDWFIEFDHGVGGDTIRIVIDAVEDMSQVS